MLSRFNTTALIRANMLKASVVSVNARDFGGKKKKKAAPEEPTEYETVEEQPVRQQQASVVSSNQPWKNVSTVLDLDRSLFQPFSVGDVKVVESTPDNQAPSYEDTIEGRYANVLFTTASQQSALFKVYEDMIYLSELYTHSVMFRQFTENGGVGLKEITELNKALTSVAESLDLRAPIGMAMVRHEVAPGDQIEVHVDGGIRSGQDVFKAIALGAHGTWIGRSWIAGRALSQMRTLGTGQPNSTGNRDSRRPRGLRSSKAMTTKIAMGSRSKSPRHGWMPKPTVRLCDSASRLTR